MAASVTSFAGARIVAGPSPLGKGSSAKLPHNSASSAAAPRAMAETTMKRQVPKSFSSRKRTFRMPQQEIKSQTASPLFIQPPPRGLGSFLPDRSSPKSGTPRSARSPQRSPKLLGGAWVVFRHEEEWDETESSLEIGLGQLKAQIPLSFPPRKPISIIRCPSVPKSPNSQMQLSFAFSFQFPVEIRKSAQNTVLLPVAMSLSFSIPLLPLLGGLGGAGCAAVAESAFEFSVGEAQASIPFCVPIPSHIPELIKASKTLPMLIHA